MISTILATALIIPSIGLRSAVYPCPKSQPYAVEECLRTHDIVKEAQKNVLMSHNYNSFSLFYNDDGSIKIKRGDKIVYARKHYEVTAVKVVKDTFVLPKADLILYTCFPFYGERPISIVPTQRLVIIAKAR